MSDEQPPDPVEERAKMFEDMAAQIRLNRDYKFGGAFLLVPPGDGEPFSSLMLRQEEAPIFWSTIKTLVQVAEEMMGKPQSGFGGRR